ncbi:hypothetical protein FHX77_001089 [Bifidobacterium commune]|uniref:hypothetical protein n=1 Tax=Bifidobacterium commune TaxID=1505727 RepID=UPI001606CCC8|nr:hypothetical protein [Bifidobacterium commune]MBB2955663.1 hypothetical protein [Bifidobacterium commune]
MDNAINDGDRPGTLVTEATLDDLEALGGNVDHGGVPQDKRHGATIIMVVVFAVIVVAALAGFSGARWYYRDKAAPGVYLGNVFCGGTERLAT